MSYTDTSIKNFIDQIITFSDTKQILKTCQNISERGFIFERLFDICIKFGFSIFNNNEYEHLVGNANNGKLKSLNFDNYLKEKVISGSSGGCSDITLKHKITKKYIFISSKYYSSDKSIDEYDIQNIIAMVDKNKLIYKDYEIFLVVKNKNKLLEKVKLSKETSDYITSYIKESNILDLNDLNNYSNLPTNLKKLIFYLRGYNGDKIISENIKDKIKVPFGAEIIIVDRYSMFNKFIYKPLENRTFIL